MTSALITDLDAELARHAPFSLMAPVHRGRFLQAAAPVSFDDGALVLEPADGPVTHLHWVRQGAVVGEQRLGAPGPFAVEAGELFPVSAVLAGRPVTATYRARGATTLLRVPAAAVQALATASPPFAEFLNGRLLQLLALSQRALQGAFAARALAEQGLESPLERWVREPPLAVAPTTPLGEALRAMSERRVGSVLVQDEAGAALGILTRHDVLDRVALPGRPLHVPVSEVMSWPVHTLDASRSAQDAALVMSREGVRHVPITRAGRVVGIVSERDLFALQRLSLRQIGSAIDAAQGLPALQAAAADIRAFALQLLAQGVAARQLTALQSQLNDRLTRRLVELAAAAQRLDLAQACWLAFGSEGREEQTVLTDQDNGIVFVSTTPAADRPHWLALGQAVNEGLAACGIPLCAGGIMAGQPACCLAVDEWLARFEGWIAHGAPQDLLNATIFFDLRPVAGQAALAEPLQRRVAERAAATPRFLRQMAEAALSHRAPLAWHGGLAGDHLDLKLQGTALFVESARVLALATGVHATSTRARLEEAGTALHVPPAEREAWVAGFEHLQLLRLGTQAAGHGNRCELAALNEIDRRVLRETLRVARRLQQRVQADWLR